MQLKDIMHKNVKIIELEDALVFDAIQEMADEDIDSLIVTNGKQVVGIITGEDLAFRCLSEGHRPWECLLFRHMSMPVVSATPTMDIVDAARLMVEKEIKHLPVMEESQLAGIVSLSDVVRALIHYSEKLSTGAGEVRKVG